MKSEPLPEDRLRAIQAEIHQLYREGAVDVERIDELAELVAELQREINEQK